MNVHSFSPGVQEFRVNFISKLYVWSVVFETLLFFILVSQNVSGVGGNLSRVLQFGVILALLIKALITPLKKIQILNPFSIYFRWYFIYFCFIIFSLIFGIFSGAYIGKSDNFSANVLRPGFEYFITLYYFVYFAVLPLFLLNSKKAIDYFFKVFFFMFFLSFFLGLIDLLLVLITGYEFIPRHLSDMTHVGNRFHGIAGEPRDAFVHLFLGLSLLFLKELWTGKSFNRFWVPIIITAALLTQSTSGVIGLLIFLSLLIVFQLPRMRFQSTFLLVLLIILGSIAFGYMIQNSPRIQIYLEAAPLALQALERGIDLPPVIEYQINNIYPVWIRWLEISEMNFLPFFIGTGLGTASIINGFVLSEGGVLNPHANIIRIFFESGIVGTLLFIIAFVKPLLKIEKHLGSNLLVFLMLLMLGVTFGHRSSALYTFFGLIIAIHLLLIRSKTEKSDAEP